MLSLVIGLGIISTATAQVVNGVYMIPAADGVYSPGGAVTDGSYLASVSSSYNGYSAPAQYTVASPSFYAPPSQMTSPPSYSATGIYSQMPYSSFLDGGYRSLGCGYGYTKASDGSCEAKSWVIGSSTQIINRTKHS